MKTVIWLLAQSRQVLIVLNTSTSHINVHTVTASHFFSHSDIFLTRLSDSHTCNAAIHQSAIPTTKLSCIHPSIMHHDRHASTATHQETTSRNHTTRHTTTNYIIIYTLHISQATYDKLGLYRQPDIHQNPFAYIILISSIPCLSVRVCASELYCSV